MTGAPADMTSLSPAAVRISATGRFARSVLTSRFSRAHREWRTQRAAFYRDLWSSAASEIGAGITPLPNGALELALGDRRIEVKETRCSIDDRETLDRAGDKVLAARLLREAGLPVPPHVVVTLTSLGRAMEFVAAAPGPCVVKPAGNTGAGQGVTTGIRSARDLRRAAVAAAAAGVRSGSVGPRTGSPLQRLRVKLGAVGETRLLVEHQIPGANYRLLFLDGSLVDAIRRDAPSVVGDGHRTLDALIDATNTDRLRASGNRGEPLVTRDVDLEQTLAAQGLRLSCVPAAGAVVALKTVINDNAAAGNVPVRDELAPELVEEGRRAAEAVGVRLAGVDIITTDPGVSLEASGGCILEVNTTPGLAMHYNGHPGQVAVADELLCRMFSETRSGSLR